jgi:hypothetical protein
MKGLVTIYSCIFGYFEMMTIILVVLLDESGWKFGMHPLTSFYLVLFGAAEIGLVRISPLTLKAFPSNVDEKTRNKLRLSRNGDNPKRTQMNPLCGGAVLS